VHKIDGSSGAAPLKYFSPLKEAAMKARQMKVRVLALMAAVCGLGVMGGVAQADEANPLSVTVSPGYLTFGVPTGSTTSAQESVTVSITGSGTAMFSSTVPPANSDFKITLDTCAGKTFSAPATCNVGLTFTPSGSSLETSSFTISYNETGLAVNLSGALGAIRLFDPINVANSQAGVNQDNLLTFASTTLNLSCSTNTPTAKLSSTPDGNGNVVVDNYVTLFVNNTPFSSPNSPTGNVCSGGVSDGTNLPDCFTQNYRDTFSVGADPDNSASTWGVPPIDVSSAFASDATAPITPAATISLVDQGTVYTSTTLFLVTSCGLTNAQTGSETGNPVNEQPSQTLSFDTVLNHLDQFSFDYSQVPTGSITNPNGTPIVTNSPVDPNTGFPTMVSSSPFSGSACIPLNSLNGKCGLKTQVCVLPGGSAGSGTGAQCPQTTAGDDFLFTATFDPVNPINNPNTIPGFLEFNDQGACPLEGPEVNSPCPQNGLVSFTGPGENGTRRGAGSTNSGMIPVTNVTPPTTAVVITPSFPAGPNAVWTNGNPQATFTGVPGATTPTVAPIKFIEYGVNPTTQGLPPTFPLPFPGNGAFPTPDPVFSAPACNSTYPPTASSFGPNMASLGPFGNGSSNLLHYSTTDCASTHELLFTLNSGSWSTSFKSITLMSDTVAPMIILTTPPVTGGSYSANQKVKANYSCTDTESGVASCAGPVASGAYIDTTPNGLSTTKTFTVNSNDNVGNAATAVMGTYTVTCHYAALTVSPTSVKRGSFVNITASVIDCVNPPQNVKVQFMLSGPLGRNCGNSNTIIFTTPTFTIRSGTSSSITFPLPILKSACTGLYTVTTTTFQGSTAIDSVSSTLTVTN
jgi:hypothetical protein